MDQATRENALLRKLTEARIACANSFHDFNTLDTLTDEWDGSIEVLETTALDIHLNCESGAKEANTILDILTGFLTSSAAPDWQWMEVEIRQGNAAGAASEVIRLVDELAAIDNRPELCLKEIKRRAEIIQTKLAGVKDMLQQLHRDIGREAERQQQEVQATGEEIS